MHCQANYPVKTVIQMFSAKGCRQKVATSFPPKFPLTVDSTLKTGERVHQMPGSSLKFTDQTLIPEGAVLGSKGCRTHSYSSKRSLLKPTGNKAHMNRGLLFTPHSRGKGQVVYINKETSNTRDTEGNTHSSGCSCFL